MKQSTASTSSLRRRIAVAVAGAGAASILMTGGVAQAAPAHPGPAKAAPAPHTKVPGTSCTLAQVEKALAKEDPALWKKISANPKHKKRFESIIVMTPQQRQAKRAQWRKSHPLESGARQFLKDHNIKPRGKGHQRKGNKQDRAKHKQEIQALRAKVKATCGQY
ncbi:hemophore-related protein [Gordonia sp. CPCC 205333]|uniref:hemophore-related protein n=1 Tax=Gordonia sp. CPCC 205333 TaxID=3140790 RepID=UPI003AF3917A